MNEELCTERHKSLDEKLKINERRLNDHSGRLDKLEQYQSRSEEKFQNLCSQIESLVTTMKWFIGLLVGSFVGFFFYAVQNNIFK